MTVLSIRPVRLAVSPSIPNGIGNITGATSGDFYDSGTSLTLTAATPVADGVGKQWRFNTWTGGATGNANPVTFSLTSAVTVTANYMAQYQLTLAITPGVPNGLSNLSGGTNAQYYDSGTILSLAAATPVAGTTGTQWRFSKWSVDGTDSSTNPVSVTMSAPHSATAGYVQQFQLTLAINPNPPLTLAYISGGTNGTYYDAGTILREWK